jgi:hypothetical protein
MSSPRSQTATVARRPRADRARRIADLILRQLRHHGYPDATLPDADV